MSKSVLTYLEKKLNDRAQTGLKRNLKIGREGLIDFASNDYLGLARSPELFDIIHHEVDSLSKKNGSTGSRLLSGNSSYIEETEEFLATIFEAEAALLFNSGYSANLSVLSSIPQKGDTILYDELAHASIKDGARLSLARRFSFRHNDLDDLEAKIKRSSGRIFIAIESIYSMDGDQCPLEELCHLAEKYDACIILDEAHSTGVEGINGNGTAISNRLADRIFIRIYTFGKAMGVHGACIAGKKNLIQYLVNFARPFIYTTALSPHSIASIKCAFIYLRENSGLQINLKTNIDTFIHETKALQNKITSISAIQTLIFPGVENVKAITYEINNQGFDVRPILSPTVPMGLERVRICLHTFNTTTEIKELSALFSSLNTLRDERL